MAGTIANSHYDKIFLSGTVIEITAYNIPGLVKNKELLEHILHELLVWQYSPLYEAGILQACH